MQLERSALPRRLQDAISSTYLWVLSLGATVLFHCRKSEDDVLCYSLGSIHSYGGTWLFATRMCSHWSVPDSVDYEISLI